MTAGARFELPRDWPQATRGEWGWGMGRGIHRGGAWGASPENFLKFLAEINAFC